MSITQSMKNIFLSYALFFLGGAHSLLAQTPQDMVQAIANAQAQSTAPTPQQVPLSSPVKESSAGADLALKSVDTKLEDEIKAFKKLDKKNKPRQFAADLFEYRQPMSSATDGGISDDYVLELGSIQVGKH